jgi:hypothetical protein
MSTYVTKQKASGLQVLLIVMGLLGYEMISFLPDWFGMDSRLFTIPYRAFFLGLCIYNIIKLLPVRSSKMDVFTGLLLVFWVFYFARLFYDSFFTAYKFGRPVEEYWLYTVCLCFIPIFAYLIPVNDPTLKKARSYSFYIAALLNLLGLYSNLVHPMKDDVTRMVGNEFLNPVAYGQMGAFLVVLGVSILIDSSKKLSGWYVLFIATLLPTGLVNIALSGSRGPLIQLIIALLALASFKLKRKHWMYIIFSVGILIGVGTVVNSTVPIFGVLFDRMSTTGSSQNISDNERLSILGNAWNGFLNSPVLGTGFEEKVFHIYPHNLLVEACMATGIAGGLIMLCIYIYSVIGSFKLLKDNTKNWIGLLCIMALITGLTTGGLWGSFKFWALIVLVNNLRYSKKSMVFERSITYHKKNNHHESIAQPGYGM